MEGSAAEAAATLHSGFEAAITKIAGIPTHTVATP
jgi:hypothetical protein